LDCNCDGDIFCRYKSKGTRFKVNFNSTYSHCRQYSFVIIVVLVLFFFSIPIADAEELLISIPQGDHTRELETVIEWYVPINHDVEVGDVVKSIPEV